jgi:hypothetical protein
VRRFIEHPTNHGFARIFLLALPVGVLALSGCGSGMLDTCTQVGCTSGIGIEIKQLPKELPGARKIDVCVADQCTRDTVYETGKPEGKYVPKAYRYAEAEARRLHGPGPYPVSVTVYDRQGAVLLRASDSVVMEKDQPNGVHCRPTCFGAALWLNVGKDTLERLPHRGEAP